MELTTATEAVAEAAEEVAEQATQVADISRGLSGRDISLVLSGVAVGTGLGVAGAFFFLRQRMETKYKQLVTDEIDVMREHYRRKTQALEGEVLKPKLEDVIAEKGYISPDAETTSPPMAVTPPDAVVDAVREAADEETKGVPVSEFIAKIPPEKRNIFEDTRVDSDWSYDEEYKKRSPLRPYVIHVDEKDASEYVDATYTYYEADDVLCNERDEIIAGADRDRLVGEANLNLFGHGSNDASIVYIRNDALQLDLEIVKSPQSYAEEVHGFTHGFDRSNIERMRERERHQFDDE